MNNQLDGYIVALAKQFYAASPERKMKLLSEWADYMPPEVIQNIRYQAVEQDNINQQNLDYLSKTDKQNLNAPLEPVQFNPISNMYQRFNGLK